MWTPKLNISSLIQKTAMNCHESLLKPDRSYMFIKGCVCVPGRKPEYTQTNGDSCHGWDLN